MYERKNVLFQKDFTWCQHLKIPSPIKSSKSSIYSSNILKAKVHNFCPLLQAAWLTTQTSVLCAYDVWIQCQLFFQIYSTNRSGVCPVLAVNRLLSFCNFAFEHQGFVFFGQVNFGHLDNSNTYPGHFLSAISSR